MSYGVQVRVKRTQYLWDQLTTEEKQNPFLWCPVSDEVIREQYPGKDVDAVVVKMSDSEFASFFRAFMARSRKRRSTIKYLRQFNTKQASDQADRLEDEQKADEEKVAAEAAQ